MKLLISALLLATVGSAAQAGNCQTTEAERILSLPRPVEPDQVLEVSEQQSVEGGQWSIYLGKNKKPDRIFRTDFGESGRTEHAIASGGNGTFVIRKTHFRYNVPSYVEGSAVIREETDYYRFCEGRLFLPTGWENDGAHLKAAHEASSQFFSAPEIGKAVISAGLKPPLWK